MASSPVISIKAEPLFRLGELVVTNSLFLSWITALLLIAAGLVLWLSLKPVPGFLQNFFELVLEKTLEFMDTIIGNRRQSEKYLPIVLTIFLFVLTANWLGLMPGVGSVGLREHGHLVPLLRAPTADLNFTIALAVISLIFINIAGLVALGWKRHMSRFFNFSNPVMSFVGFLELVSEFVKIVSFSFRLFGNVFAGEVLLVIIGFLVPYVVPLPFLLMEFFVGIVQAFIFAMLTLVFIALAVSHEEAH
ncbi:MAG TPA: F0F1 ATP synthase subunit A [Candidatus Paceibacterota bacterium]|nr:F0F1 ATP synthase subunit A [Candidatus Paceibacterota bacterium]